jgi:hypothetical protein
VKQPSSFYATYVTIVYGILTGIGLQDYLTPSALWNSHAPELLRLGGTLLTVLHFWLICLVSDPVADKAYRGAVSPKRYSLGVALFLIDVVFATIFAAVIALMLRSVTQPKWFFDGFLILALSSLLYDGLSLILLRDGTPHTREPVYLLLLRRWLSLDSLYVVCAALLWYASRGRLKDAISGSLFILTALAGLVLDTVIANPKAYVALQRH